MQDLRKFFNTIVLPLAGTFILGLCGPASSAAAADSEKAVRDAVQRYADAWNKADIKAMAACWSPDGEFIGPSGTVTKVDDLLSRESQQLSQDQRPTLTVTVTTIRFPAAGVALVDGTTELAHSSPTVIDHARFSSLYLLRDGTWLLARVQELDAPENKLEELEWLIGSWEGVVEESTVRSTVQWSENKKFLVRKFQVVEGGRVALTGTQRIGWDPVTQRPKSWYFDSDGSFGEGLWEKQDGQWIITVRGVLEDGAEVSSTNVYTRLDNDKILRRSLRTRVGDQDLPDEEIRVVRTGKAS